MDNNYIQRIEISGLWGKHDIVWNGLHSDVNILVGINGSGKSTLLNIVDSVLSGDKKDKSKFSISEAIVSNKNTNSDFIHQNFGGFGYAEESFAKHSLINTFDVPVSKNKLKADESPLMLELRQLILQTGTNSFNDYRLRATTSISNAQEISKRIKAFFSLIDSFFVNTGKKIEIDTSNKIVFISENEIIQLEQLSSGEKQLLIILFKVFLMDNQPYILLMDEPEISLHISWQQDLISTLRKLNPNCQLIIATHSPSIFGKGWGDKVTFMEKLFQK